MMESKPVKRIPYPQYSQRFSAPSILFNCSFLEMVSRGRQTLGREIIVYSSSSRFNLSFADTRFCPLRLLAPVPHSCTVSGTVDLKLG